MGEVSEGLPSVEGVLPHLPHGFPQGSPRRVATAGDRVPHLPPLSKTGGRGTLVWPRWLGLRCGAWSAWRSRCAGSRGRCSIRTRRTGRPVGRMSAPVGLSIRAVTGAGAARWRWHWMSPATEALQFATACGTRGSPATVGRDRLRRAAPAASAVPARGREIILGPAGAAGRVPVWKPAARPLRATLR